MIDVKHAAIAQNDVYHKASSHKLPLHAYYKNNKLPFNINYLQIKETGVTEKFKSGLVLEWDPSSLLRRAG